VLAGPQRGWCSGVPPVKAQGGEASGGTGGPSWLGGGAWAAVIWRGIDDGVARKIAAALVLQRGSPGWVFIGEILQICCTRIIT
jgi:hypothetical protein